jgi:NAD+ diphosphatase
MIQDIAPQVMHNEFRDEGPEKAGSGETVFVCGERSVACRVEEGAGVFFPSLREFLSDGGEREELHYLFAIDERRYWLYLGEKNVYPMAENADDAAENERERYALRSTRILRRTQPKAECYAAETAYHLYVWYRDNRYCGRCGGRNEFSHKERAMCCPSCGNIIYPKIAPAVIVGIMNEDKDKIIVTRYAGRAHKGNALVAGFCEIGETAEDTVRREVMEEVGLHVRDVHYYKSQPWGFDLDLLLGYYCTADETESIQMDGRELARAVWVGREDLGEENAQLSLTADMIMNFKRGDV